MRFYLSTSHQPARTPADLKAINTRDSVPLTIRNNLPSVSNMTPIDQIRTVAVEEWLRSIPRAKGTKAKIRNTMSVLFTHAIRWDFVRNNPITGPVRGSGVRQSAKREHMWENSRLCWK